MTPDEAADAVAQTDAYTRATAITLAWENLPERTVLIDLDRLSQRAVLTEYARLQDIDLDDAILELLGSVLAYPRGVDVIAGVLTKAKSCADGIRPPERKAQ